MPTQSFNKTLQAPNTRFSQPVRAVRDDSTSKAISAIGELGFAVDKQIRKTSLQSDLQDLEGQAIASTTSPEQEASDAKEVSGFQAKINRLKNAVRSGASESAIKLRAESILKEHIARAPGLSTELRGVASGVLGFDPTGSSLQQAFSQTEIAQKQLDVFQKRFIELGGGVSADFASPAGVTYLENAEDLLRKAADNQRIIDLATSTNQLANINLPQKLTESGTGSFIQVRKDADDVIKRFTGKPLSELTDSDIRNIKDVNGLKLELSNLGLESTAALQGVFGSKPGITESNINEAGQASKDYITLALSRLDVTTSLEELKNANTYTEQLILNKALGDPTLKNFTIFKKLFPNTALPPSTTTAALVAFGKIANGVGVNPFTDSGVKTKEQSGSIENTYKSIFKSIATSKEFTPEQGRSAANMVRGFSKGTAKNFSDMPQKDKDSLITILQDKSVAESIAKVKDTESGSNLKNAAADYLTLTLDNLTNSIEDELDFSVSGELKVKDAVIVTKKDGVFTVEPISPVKDSDKIANFVRSTWLTRINKAITAISNLDGVSNEDTIFSLAKKNRLANPFIKFFVDDGVNNGK